MNPIYMFLVVSSLAMSVMAVAVPDKICGTGVSIDFTAKDPLAIDRGATIQQVSEFAAKVQEEYLRPNITSGNISARDVYLLYFCLETFDSYVKRFQQSAASEMGLLGVMGGGDSLRCPFPSLKDTKGGEFRIQDSLRGTLDKLVYELPSDLRSHCAAYNYQRIGNAFVGHEEIHTALVEARDTLNWERVDSIGQIGLDPKRYERYSDDLRKDVELSSGDLKDVSLMGALGGAVAGVGGACAALAWGGPWGWAASGGVVVGSLVAGGCSYYYRYRQKKYWVNLCQGSSDDIHRFVNHLDTRISHLRILTDEDGLYQTAYMNVVWAQHLLEQWQQGGWMGVGALTIRSQDKLKEWAEATKIRNRDSLTRLEDALVNYPLVGTILEAQAVCVYLNYLDKKGKGWLSGSDEELRRYWLKNSSKVAKLCSGLGSYSTSPVAPIQAECYNRYFEHTYATNRFTTIEEMGCDSKHDSKSTVLAPPIFKPSEEADVKDAGLKLLFECGYAELVSAYSRMQANKALKGVVETLLGDAILGEWTKNVARNIKDYWMFPRWSSEACQLGIPANSDQVLKIVNGSWLHYAIEACLQKNCEESGAEPLKILAGDVWEVACTEEEAKRHLVSFVERRSLPKGVERKIKEKYGTVEKMAADWVGMVLEIQSRGNSPTSEQEKTSADAFADLAEIVKNEILPLWTEICAARVKWWRRIFIWEN